MAKRIVLKFFAKTDEVFLYAYFLYAQEIGERRRGGYAPRPPCRPHFKCADGGYSLAKNNAFATKVGRKGCLCFWVSRVVFSVGVSFKVP